MAQAIRQSTVVKSDGKIEIQDTQLPEGARVEVIVIVEENTPRKSAEALAIERLPYLDDPSQLITVIDADQEIDEHDTPDEEIKASLRRSLQEVKEGKTRPISELWDRIDDE